MDLCCGIIILGVFIIFFLFYIEIVVLSVELILLNFDVFGKEKFKKCIICMRLFKVVLFLIGVVWFCLFSFLFGVMVVIGM